LLSLPLLSSTPRSLSDGDSSSAGGRALQKGRTLLHLPLEDIIRRTKVPCLLQLLLPPQLPRWVDRRRRNDEGSLSPEDDS
jgi:hypothetical protein